MYATHKITIKKKIKFFLLYYENHTFILYFIYNILICFFDGMKISGEHTISKRLNFNVDDNLNMDFCSTVK